MSPADPPSLTRSLTARGRVVALAALFAWLLAWTVGGALASVAAALAALLLIGLLFAWTPLRRVKIGALLPASGTAGQPFELRVPVEHTGRFGVLEDATVRVVVGTGTRPLGFLAALRPGQSMHVRGVHRIARRGRHSRLALVIDSTDPLGILCTTARHDVAADLLVLPRVVALRDLPLEHPPRAGAVDAAPSPRGAAQEPFGVREWRPGESLRHVHWRLSARRGDLLVRELRGEERPSTHVVLDPRVAGSTRERRRAFEDAVTLTASVAAHELGERRAVRLSLAGPERTVTRSRRGRSALPAMLSTLAGVVSEQPETPVAGLHPVRGEDVIVVTAGGGRLSDLETWGDAAVRVLDVDSESVRAALVRRGARHRRFRRARRAPERSAPSLMVYVAGVFGLVIGVIVLLAERAPPLAVLAISHFPGLAAALEGRGPSKSLRRAAPIGLVSLAVVGLGTVMVHDVSLAAVVVLLAALSFTIGRLPAESARTSVPALALALAVAAFATLPSGLVGLALLAVALVAFNAAGEVLSTRRRAAVARVTKRSIAAGTTRVRRFLRPIAATAVFAALLVVLQPLAAWAPLRSLSVSGDLIEDREFAEGGRAEDGGRGLLSAAALRHEFPSGVSGEGIPLPGYEIIMEVEPRRSATPAGWLGPLLLRGIAMARFGPGGPRSSTIKMPGKRLDRSDGVADGWTQVGSPVSDRDAVELRVSQYDMPVPPHGWSLLFATANTQAVRLPELRHDPERFTVLDEAPAEWFTYDLRARDPGRGSRVDHSMNTEASSGWHTQLPPPTPALTRVAAEAKRITSRARSDLDRVQRVVSFFQRGFSYSRETTRSVNAAGVVDLLERREGYCTHYATAAALMLRTQGLPARIVSGFTVHEWDAARNAYVVRPRDTHAWIEVRFADVGWVAFDPTPPDPDRDTGRGTTGPTAKWAEQALDDVAALLGGGGTAALRALRATLSRTPRSIRLLVAALVLAALLAQIAYLIRRGRGAGPGTPIDPAAREALLLSERLERALARRGFRRGPAETRGELAGRVVGAAGAGMAALLPAARDLDAARFGGRPLDGDARARIEALVRSLSA